MTFVFQQPASAGLLHAIDNCANGAHGGGGIFAFASRGGVDAFLSLPNVKAMLSKGHPFHLIVGIDAITNSEALICLDEHSRKYKKLTTEVFLHSKAPCTFHPKFSWFNSKDEISLITGSGNLTERGLGKQPTGQDANWEAFSIQSLKDADAATVSADIDAWLAAQRKAGTLRSLGDKDVLEKAMENARVRYASSGATKAPKAKPATAAAKHAPTTTAVALSVTQPSMAEVLVRELPKTRGGQGDIGQTAHRDFFGHHGTDKNIFMQYVDLNDSLHTVRKVWLFFNSASDNYRLELPESKENYEVGANDERMILVTVKLDARSFRYTLVRPGTDNPIYKKVATLFGKTKKGGRRLMRERFISADELQEAWDNVPSNLLPLSLPAVEP